VPFDARILCATNKDLRVAVRERAFREDLFFRINVVHVELPPLSARGSDVLLLADRFLRRIADQAEKPISGITNDAKRRLAAYHWPGNVRELMNCIERAVALTRNRELDVDDLPDSIRNHVRPDPVTAPRSEEREELALLSLDEVERRHILRVFDRVGGNKALAAKVLGVDRKTLYRKLDRMRLGEKCKESELQMAQLKARLAHDAA
jgi:two-component system response regulator HydG